MSERLSNNESQHNNEVGIEAAKRSAELKRSGEHSEHNQVDGLESARKEALELAVSGQEKSPAEAEARPKAVMAGTKKQREQSFKHTIRTAQKQMHPAERAFSKVIHNPIIEKTSDVVGSTIARPDSIVSGALCSFILVLGLYMLGRYYGFSLSGFETIGAFALGWVVGLVFDGIRFAIRSRK